MLHLRIFLFATVAICLCSCQHDTISDQIYIAEKLVDSKPDSALNVLKKIEQENLKPRQLPLFSLLYTQAQLNQGIKLESDSLINIAFRAYGENGSTEKSAQTYLCMALINYNKKEFRNAMTFALNAFNISQTEHLYELKAKASQIISDLYFDAYNFPESEKYARIAANNFSLANNPILHDFALCDIAIIKLNRDENVTAISMLDSLRSIYTQKVPENIDLLQYITKALRSAYAKTNRVKDAENLTVDTSPGSYNAEHIDEAIVQNRISRLLYGPESASRILNATTEYILSKEDSAHILLEHYKNLKLLNDFEAATNIADTHLRLQPTIAQEFRSESIGGGHRDFYIAQQEKQKSRNRFLVIAIVSIVCLSLLAAAIIIKVHRQKQQNLRAEVEALMYSLMASKQHSEQIIDENNVLLEILEERSGQMKTMQLTLMEKLKKESQLQNVIKQLFKEKWNTINILCNEYFEIGNVEQTKVIMFNRIVSELQKLKTDKVLRQIENAVNQYLDNVVCELRKECPNIKESDITFMTLIYAGFSVRTVCFMTNIKYKYFYLKKTRLINKLLASDAVHKDKFINLMN